jgi:hypothetical protein
VPVRSKYPIRPAVQERVVIYLTEAEKRELFAIAAQRRASVSELVRRTIATDLSPAA